MSKHKDHRHGFAAVSAVFFYIKKFVIAIGIGVYFSICQPLLSC